jgi:transcriptional regulator with XRE-family HTH domain
VTALDTKGRDVWACVESMPEPISQAAGTLGQRIKRYRGRLGISQEALADRAGLHWTFIGQVERGQRNLSLHNLLKIAAGLGVDPAKLVQGLEPPPGDSKSA